MGSVISVIIPARDCEAVIGACLASLATQSRRADEVIVVNDASVDGTAEVVSQSRAGARLVSLAPSRGFTGACRAGLEQATGDWIAVLNADTQAHPQWLAEMEAATLDERVGMIASRVLRAEPAGAVDSLGLVIKKSGMALLRGRGQRDRPDASVPRFEEVFGPAGSAAMYRRAMLDEAGFFERDFEIYYEDVDLAFRARWAGWSCLLANRARVIHRHSHTMSGMGARKRMLLQRNRLRCLVRNWPGSRLALYFPAIAVYDLASVALAFFEGSLTAPVKARAEAIMALPRDLRARREIMSKKKISAREMGRWLAADHAGAPGLGPGAGEGRGD